MVNCYNLMVEFQKCIGGINDKKNNYHRDVVVMPGGIQRRLHFHVFNRAAAEYNR